MRAGTSVSNRCERFEPHNLDCRQKETWFSDLSGRISKTGQSFATAKRAKIHTNFPVSSKQELKSSASRAAIVSARTNTSFSEFIYSLLPEAFEGVKNDGWFHISINDRSQMTTCPVLRGSVPLRPPKPRTGIVSQCQLSAEISKMPATTPMRRTRRNGERCFGGSTLRVPTQITSNSDRPANPAAIGMKADTYTHTHTSVHQSSNGGGSNFVSVGSVHESGNPQFPEFQAR